MLNYHHPFVDSSLASSTHSLSSLEVNKKYARYKALKFPLKETYLQTFTRLSQPPLTKRFTGAFRVPVVESKAAFGPIAGAQLTALQPICKIAYH